MKTITQYKKFSIKTTAGEVIIDSEPLVQALNEIVAKLGEKALDYILVIMAARLDSVLAIEGEVLEYSEQNLASKPYWLPLSMVLKCMGEASTGCRQQWIVLEALQQQQEILCNFVDGNIRTECRLINLLDYSIKVQGDDEIDAFLNMCSDSLRYIEVKVYMSKNVYEQLRKGLMPAV